MSTATATKSNKPTATKPVKASKALAAPTTKAKAVDPLSEALAVADVTSTFDLAALQALREQVKASSNRGRKAATWSETLEGLSIYIFTGSIKPLKMASAQSTASRLREQLKEQGVSGWTLEVYGYESGQPSANKGAEFGCIVFSK